MGAWPWGGAWTHRWAWAWARLPGYTTALDSEGPFWVTCCPGQSSNALGTVQPGQHPSPGPAACPAELYLLLHRGERVSLLQTSPLASCRADLPPSAGLELVIDC